MPTVEIFLPWVLFLPVFKYKGLLMKLAVCVCVRAYVRMCVYLLEKLPGEMSKASKLTEVRSEQEHRSP